jgi:hypothetical protein
MASCTLFLFTGKLTAESCNIERKILGKLPMSSKATEAVVPRDK